MGRMRIRHFAAAAVLAAAVLALATCSNPVDLVEAATVEVMKANDRYLEVVDFSPENNDQSASPTGKITLIVDRAVDMDSVPAAIQFRNVTANSDVTWTSQYFPSTRSLVVQADSYLTADNDYSVTVSGLRGTDGSRMLETLSFGFKAGRGPAGTTTLAGLGDPGYTSNDTITLTISQNGYASGYAISLFEADLQNPGTIPEGSWTATSTLTKSITLASVDGLQNVFVIFRGKVNPDDEMAYSTIYSPSIIRDKTPPVVNVGPDLFASSVFSAGIGYGAAVTEANIKSYKWSWSGASVTFGSDTSSATSITGTTDGNRTIRFTVTDKAGNTGYDDFILTWDNTPTYAPTVSGSSVTLDQTPTWTWYTNGGGNGTYYYQLDSGAWSSSTTATSYTPSSALSDGSHTLYVKTIDATLGYESSVGSRAIRVTPVIPYSGQTGVSKAPTVSWRVPPLFLGSYAVQVKVFDGRFWSWQTVVSGLTTNSYVLPGTLDPFTVYTWRIAATYKLTTSYIPSEAGASFTTGK